MKIRRRNYTERSYPKALNNIQNNARIKLNIAQNT